MTQKQRIIDIFNIPELRACCSEICHILTAYKQDKKTKLLLPSLNASVSSQLRKFVKEGILEVIPNLIGPRGGQVYQKIKQ